MSTEQLRAEFEAWAQDKTELYKMARGEYSSRITRFALEAYQAGRAALQSQDLEDAERFRKIINMTRAEREEVLFFPEDKDVIKAIDAARAAKGADHA